MLQLELFTLKVDTTLATRLESNGYFSISSHSLLPDQTIYLFFFLRGVVIFVVDLMLNVKEIKAVTVTLLYMSLLKGVLRNHPKLPCSLVHQRECLGPVTGHLGYLHLMVIKKS